MPRRSRSYSRSRSRSHDRDRRWSRSPPRRIIPGYRGGDYPPNTQIYIARFSRRTRDGDLRRQFEKYGRIISVDVKYHGCYAFIVYEDSRSASDAIEDMNGRPLPYENERLTVEQAGANRGRARRRSPRGFRERGGSPRRGPDRDDICYNCNKTGHWAADCKEEQVSKTREIREGRCFTCGRRGHKRADCTEAEGSRRKRSYSKSSRSRSRSRSSRKSSKSRDRRSTSRSRRHHHRSRSLERRRHDRKDETSKGRRRDSSEKKSRDKVDRERQQRDERSVSPDRKTGSRSVSKDTFKSPSPTNNKKRSKSGSRDDPRS